MKLKATKTSLYNLISAHRSLPPMERVTFVKVPRSRRYFMEWYDGFVYYTAYFTEFLEDSIVMVTGRDLEGVSTADEAYRIGLVELRERKMLEGTRCA